MKKKLLILSAFCLSIFILIFYLNDQNKYTDIKIAILDSGINNDKLIHKKYNTLTNNSKTEDKFNHGTKIFNVIHNSSPKNQKAKYYDIQVLNEDGLGSVENVCKGIEKSIEFDVNIISMSLGFNNHNDKLYNCIKKATNKNIIVIAASGDTLSNNTDYPAKYEEVLSIAAIDDKNNIFSFSSTGKIDFVDHGVNIKTKDNKNKKVKESGSSIATANFTGKLMHYFTKDTPDKESVLTNLNIREVENYKKLE